MYENNVIEFNQFKKKYIDFPSKVHLETIASCNLQCRFCIYPKIDRIHEKMSDDLFLKIIEDLKQIPKNHQYIIQPYKVNEPLLDKSIFKKLNIINNELPNARILFNTNGILLNEENIEFLCKVRNIEYIWISLNATNREDYKNITGKDSFDIVLKNIKNLISKFDKPELIKIGKVEENASQNKEFEEFIKKEFGMFINAAINPISEFFFKNQKKLYYQEIPCIHWFEVSITANGKVSFCCSDGNCSYPIGDINVDSILDIYNSTYFKSIRVNKLKRDFDPCDKCLFV